MAFEEAQQFAIKLSRANALALFTTTHFINDSSC